MSAQIGGTDLVLGGDIITQVDGRPVSSSDDLSALISGHKPGDEVKITVVRGGRTQTLTATLDSRPSTAGSG
jgi:putative serine protease PepD